MQSMGSGRVIFSMWNFFAWACTSRWKASWSCFIRTECLSILRDLYFHEAQTRARKMLPSRRLLKAQERDYWEGQVWKIFDFHIFSTPTRRQQEAQTWSSKGWLKKKNGPSFNVWTLSYISWSIEAMQAHNQMQTNRFDISCLAKYVICPSDWHWHERWQETNWNAIKCSSLNQKDKETHDQTRKETNLLLADTGMSCIWTALAFINHQDVDGN